MWEFNTLPLLFLLYWIFYICVVFNDECIKPSKLSPSMKVILLLKYQHVGVICLIMELSELLPSLKVIL